MRGRLALGLALLLVPASVMAQSGFDPVSLDVAYPALAAGQNRDAINQLLADKSIDANDPSRLINLGAAYARIGRADLAETMFRAAIKSDIRYDLELADGSMMDSRLAARLALSRLNKVYAAR